MHRTDLLTAPSGRSLRTPSEGGGGLAGPSASDGERLLLRSLRTLNGERPLLRSQQSRTPPISQRKLIRPQDEWPGHVPFSSPRLSRSSVLQSQLRGNCSGGCSKRGIHCTTPVLVSNNVRARQVKKCRSRSCSRTSHTKSAFPSQQACLPDGLGSSWGKRTRSQSCRERTQYPWPQHLTRSSTPSPDERSRLTVTRAQRQDRT